MIELSCYKINNLLSAYLENQLDTATTLTVANHLENCPSCEKELNQLTKISSLLKTAIQQANESDLTLATRANAINDRVKEQIALTIAQTKQPTNNVISIQKPIKTSWIKKVILSLAASILIAMLSVFSLTYYATATGPLLIGAARNHQFCSAIELSNIGLHKGHSKTELSKQFNTKFPELDTLGIKFADLHPCEVYQTSFLHLMYLKGDNQVSVYYGLANALDKFKETQTQINPEQLYLETSGSLQVGAVSTKENTLWLIAGELSQEEIKAISSNLLKTRAFEEKQAELFH
ncbi:MAG: zf-HC2 domain-containing protein [Blastocatellia bacterium]|nr:zf-HC2 domain-containing protein [Blastocatellia bacterium]MBL8197022.1 zf-HC2 domain-containing protein [Blastocatellia bacterium]MBN8724555.1 zf-HC2 domain-containing protein [Acidobacteriota bacterium]